MPVLPRMDMAGSARPTLSRQADEKRIYHGRQDALRFRALRAQKNFRNKDFELISGSILPSLLEISFSLPYTSVIRQGTACRGGRRAAKRHINGTNMEQTGVKAGSRRRKIGVKLEISITFVRSVAEIFLFRHNFAPKAPGLGEKVAQKRPVGPKNRGIFITWRLHRFICPKFRQVLNFSGIFAAGPVRRPFSFQGINI